MSLEWTRRKGYVRVVDGLSRTLGDYPYTSPYAPYSYLVFERAGITYARNGLTGELEFSDKDAAKVIQSAIDAIRTSRGGRLLFKFGSWVRRMVITVNMKPEIKSSPPPRFDRCLI